MVDFSRVGPLLDGRLWKIAGKSAKNDAMPGVEEADRGLRKFPVDHFAWLR